MTFPRAGRLGCLLLLVLFSGAGCFLDPTGGPDEQKEPHYLTGKSRVAAYDYLGAVQAFDLAIQANPNSSSAHLELGLLLSDKEAVLDYAGAIYHLQRYLRLQANAHNADMIRERITVCKQGLAREVPLGPITQQVQREIMKLTGENARLTNEVAVLRQQLDQMRLYLAQRAAQVSTNPPAQAPVVLPPGMVAPSNRPPARPLGATSVPPSTANHPVASSASTTNPAPGSLTGPAARILPPPPSHAAPATPAATPPAQSVRTTPRTYVVKQGDTPGGIAKRFGVKLSDLMAANPGLKPTRMRVGRSLNIPGP